MDEPQPSASSDGANWVIADWMIANSLKRQCWVCFGTEQDDVNTQDVIWVCPCKCKGTMKWVHEECLQRWVDEKQKRTNSIRVSCSQCRANYVLAFPPANRFVRLIELYDKLLYGSSPFVAVSVVLGSFYLCCASYGFISIIQVMGYDEGRRLIDEADPLLLIIGLPAIPVSLILAKLVKWEDFLLKLWRQSAHKLPRPLTYFIDKPPARPRANCDQILTDPGFNEPLGCTRMICGALLLPSVSALIGKIFFSTVTQSSWRRSLMGGLAFIILKGALKIYLRKSQYIRYSQRTIKNYVSIPKCSSAPSVGRRSPADLDHSSSIDDIAEPQTPADEFESAILRHNSDDGNLEDDSDSEDQAPRTRPVFSMTISLGG